MKKVCSLIRTLTSVSRNFLLYLLASTKHIFLKMMEDVDQADTEVSELTGEPSSLFKEELLVELPPVMDVEHFIKAFSKVKPPH